MKWLVVPAVLFAVLYVLAPLIRSSLVDWNDIASGSMLPTILPGDRAVVNKLAFGFRIPFVKKYLLQGADPRRGDLVVFFSPDENERLLKRVVGLPGEQISLLSNVLVLNGESASHRAIQPPDDPLVQRLLDRGGRIVEESFEHCRYPLLLSALDSPDATTTAVRLGTDQFFLLGDHRDNSRDSRYFGAVPRSHIVGRVTRVAFSFGREDGFQRRKERTWMDLPDPCPGGAVPPPPRADPGPP